MHTVDTATPLDCNFWWVRVGISAGNMTFIRTVVRVTDALVHTNALHHALHGLAKAV